MLARLYSVTLEGIDGILCEVEVDVSRGGFEKPVIVGLPDTAVKESIERVRSAVVNSGYSFPNVQPLINLAPADVKKRGVDRDRGLPERRSRKLDRSQRCQFGFVSRTAIAGPPRRSEGRACV